ncbi:MAG TPA: hypothetical protein VI792_00455 [Candidatus Eisenbacteria bacterium]
MTRLRSVLPLVLALVALPRPGPAGTAGSARAAGSPGEARALIGRVLAAYGGRPALAAVTAYRAEGDLFSLRRHESAPVTRLFARPDRLKVLIEYEGAPEARIVDGAKGWRSSPGGELEPASGPMLDAMVLQAARAGVPWILAERESVARAIPPLERGGRRLPGIEIPLGGGLLVRAYVDPVTFRVEVSQGFLEHAGMRTFFETDGSDFRQVQGIWFAFREENWASGVQTGFTTLRQVILNPALRPGEFAPPPPSHPAPRGRSS